MLFLLSSLIRLSSVSAVFDFNASLIDVAPVSSMLFPADFLRMERSGLLMGSYLCVVSFVFTAQIKCSECCV